MNLQLASINPVNGIAVIAMQKQRRHSVQLPEILQVEGLVVLCERCLVLEPELLVVREVRAQIRQATLVERQQ